MENTTRLGDRADNETKALNAPNPETNCDSFKITNLRVHVTKTKCSACTTMLRCAELILPNNDVLEGEFTYNKSDGSTLVYVGDKGTNLEQFRVDNQSYNVPHSKTEEYKFDHRCCRSVRSNSKSAFELPSLNHIFGDTGSSQTMSLIKSWIDNCLYEHSQCCQREETLSALAHFPKRIIDVRSDRVKLLEDYKVPKGGADARYACLSHVWGDVSKMTRTTKDVLEEYKKEIPVVNIIPKFRQAIDTCRRLGISFLWIDALCIIQDDESDWEAEAANMGSIYYRAFITLGAIGASSSGGALYAKADRSYLSKLMEEGVHVRRRLPDSLPTMFGTESIEDAPLFTRGWAFQEMLLSCRFVCFAANEVWWQCCSYRYAEHGVRRYEPSKKDKKIDESAPVMEHGGQEVFGNTVKIQERPNVSGKLFGGLQRSGYMKKAVTIFDSNFLKSRGFSPEDTWHTVVELYSALQLTNESDRLPALAAVAYHMQLIRGPCDDYLAGVWRNTILKDLNWISCKPEKQRSRRWRAPTWSWASINGPIIYLPSYTPLTELTEVISAGCVTRGPTHLGLAIDANLVIRSTLFKGSLAGLRKMHLTLHQSFQAMFLPDFGTLHESTEFDQVSPRSITSIGFPKHISDNLTLVPIAWDVNSERSILYFQVLKMCAKDASFVGVSETGNYGTYERKGIIQLLGLFRCLEKSSGVLIEEDSSLEDDRRLAILSLWENLQRSTIIVK